MVLGGFNGFNGKLDWDWYEIGLAHVATDTGLNTLVYRH